MRTLKKEGKGRNRQYRETVMSARAFRVLGMESRIVYVRVLTAAQVRVQFPDKKWPKRGEFFCTYAADGEPLMCTSNAAVVNDFVSENNFMITAVH